MWAKIVIEVPDARAAQVRQYLAYMYAKTITLAEYLQEQLIPLKGAFGPECTATVLDSGTGTAPQ